MYSFIFGDNPRLKKEAAELAASQVCWCGVSPAQALQICSLDAVVQGEPEKEGMGRDILLSLYLFSSLPLYFSASLPVSL